MRGQPGNRQRPLHRNVGASRSATEQPPDPYYLDWADKTNWPYGGADHHFIGEVIEMLGRQLYGQEWTGEELWPNDWPKGLRQPEGDLETATDESRDNAAQLLNISREGTDQAAAYPWLLSEGDWREAKEFYPVYLERREHAPKRGQMVKAKLRELCAHGKLVAAYRMPNGSHQALKAHNWNNADCFRWLDDGYLDYRDANILDWHVNGGERLFVERGSVAEFFADRSSESPSDRQPIECQYVSPYLRLMLEATRRLGLGPDNQPKKDVIASVVNDLAAELGIAPLSAKLLDAIGTLLREPVPPIGYSRPERLAQ
jgi:hypothetical protein